MKRLFLFFFATQLGSCVQAQSFDSIYRLSKKVDIPLAIISVAWAGGVNVYGTFFLPLPPKQSLSSLNRNDVNPFDRGATYRNSAAAGYASDALLYASVGMPLLHLIDKRTRKDFWKIALMNGEAVALNLALTGTLKITAQRKRPLLYKPNIPIDSKYQRDNFQSFFSGHTSLVATEAFFFAKTFADYHPNSKVKPLVWSLCAVLPAVTGVLRYEAGKHYWTDIITGYAVGALVGVGVPYVHQRMLKRFKGYKL